MLPKIVGFLLNILSIFSSKSAARIAFKLFSVPRKGQITKQQAVFLDSAIQNIFYYKNNQIMTYKWKGNKDTVLLIHGWESNAGRWMDLITDLQKKDYTIVALDAPAHGNSGSLLFNAVLYAEFINVITKQFKPTIMVAHSMGGLAAAFSISKYKIKNIQKLILAGVPCKYSDVIMRYAHMMKYKKTIISKLKNSITEHFNVSPEALSTAKNIEKLNTKGLIIHDKEDNIIPYNDALIIKSSLKNSKLISTKGFGHSLKDSSVNSKIIEFITS
ncbi:alpha/beta hydrolase [Pseudalgibacter alginicilyticus]|uniref:Alpha/beta hydrolase n=1 Tax=Pseudalgibacter alginicilyticus TaxID=1736674 RepID=A0A0P0CJ37_9FLAO|nr:alpha/beta fold hydrolase [Pseudalgibacter alginicilyticus]ALJ06210.1 alpha/beta hydrolase [Pseudalgibacter alginicilyticus]